MHLQVLYGGTFDPVHAGHVAVACHARDALAANIHLMPAGDPPHKGVTGADAQARVAMLRLAVAGIEGLVVDTREIDRDGPSYTIDTLRDLRARQGMRASWAILVGADSFLSFDTWRDWREIFDLAHVVVAQRPGHGLGQDLPVALADAVAGRWQPDPVALHAQPAGLVHVLQQPLFPQSASELRRRIASGESWEDWVAPAVADYIRRHRLYAERRL